MGKKRGSPQVTNTEQDSGPWRAQAPYLEQGFGRALHNLQYQPSTFYPGQTVAPFAGSELEALRLGENRARTGSASTNAARDYAMGILSGNPEALKATLGPKVGQLLPGLQSQFNRAGMGNSSLARAAEQELVMNQLANLRESAANRLQQMGPQEYMDIDRLAGYGGARRGMQQRLIDEQVARHQFAEDAPNQQLARYMGLIQGNYGGTSTGTNAAHPMAVSRIPGLIGGAAGGAQMGSQFGPWGAGIGGILGGLGGAF